MSTVTISVIVFSTSFILTGTIFVAICNLFVFLLLKFVLFLMYIFQFMIFLVPTVHKNSLEHSSLIVMLTVNVRMLW